MVYPFFGLTMVWHIIISGYGLLLYRFVIGGAKQSVPVLHARRLGWAGRACVICGVTVCCTPPSLSTPSATADTYQFTKPTPRDGRANSAPALHEGKLYIYIYIYILKFYDVR
jgi:hypothetical protein